MEKSGRVGGLRSESPPPVADCLLLQAHKDKSDKTNGLKERWSVTLEDVCGLEPGLSYDGVSYTLSLVCLSQAVVLGFDSKEALLAWDIRICYSLGEVHRFDVGVLPGTKLETGPAILHLCNNLLVITREFPPTVIGQWNLPDLRRYGAVPNGFVFEGGTRCGYWAGVFFLACVEGKQISFLFDCIVRGISPTRVPFGLRPVLPDPSVSPVYLEERLNHEAQELEKRLSLLSHGSQQSSTASSVAGDDRSISSSSDTSDSHSDSSLGSCLAVWAEPVMSPAPAEPAVAPVAADTAPGDGKPCAVVRGGVRPPPKPPCSRRLHEIGRQGSFDSGIATASHSSYSGSFSSYAGSLDIGRGDEFGSLPSPPPNVVPDLDLCTCPPRDPDSEYRVPCSPKNLYDRPRSLFLGLPKGPNLITPKDQTTPAPLSPEPGGGSREPGETSANPIPTSPVPRKQGQALESKSSDTEGPTPQWELHRPPSVALRSLFAACPVCGGLKGTTLWHSGFLPVVAAPENTKDGVLVGSHRHGRLTWEITQKPGETRPQRRDRQSRSNYFRHFPCGPYCRSCETEFTSSKTNGWGRSLCEPTVSSCGEGNELSVSLKCTEGLVYENCAECTKNRSSLLARVHVAAPCSSVCRRPLLVSASRCKGMRRPSCGVPEGNSGEVSRPYAEVQGRGVQCLSAAEGDKRAKRREERRKAGVAYEVTEGQGTEKTVQCEEKSSYEMMARGGQQRLFRETEGAGSAVGPSVRLKPHREHGVAVDPKESYELMVSSFDAPKRCDFMPEDFGGGFLLPLEMAVPDRCRGDGVTYVNIPVSPHV
ncbi:hypothetical protein SKAU_G00039400 [Synaphobranchus kaupii]|uniref:IRS-type PTB domain-containing protein n=1 Tax=Synaphobranchus kaupii TaxID=118154 RepID=A0A9Q1GI38_SYNKA|nr:hypothetical protein SKAU_G00039400 [Synaphobranchus kaupii]